MDLRIRPRANNARIRAIFSSFQTLRCGPIVWSLLIFPALKFTSEQWHPLAELTCDREWKPTPMRVIGEPFLTLIHFWNSSARVDKASDTETADSRSIPGRVKPKTVEIGIHCLPA